MRRYALLGSVDAENAFPLVALYPLKVGIAHRARMGIEILIEITTGSDEIEGKASLRLGDYGETESAHVLPE
jgi:hypothetical protein